MKICITGAAGYVGSTLVPYLLDKGHEITVLDTFWFGDYLPSTEIHKIKLVKGDIRNIEDLRYAFHRKDAVIHLACVSNDPSFDMNPELGKSINYDCFRNILTVLQEKHVGRFIYASSSSVYGVSGLDDVTEDAPKNPLTDYSKYKLMCEEELEKYGMGGVWTILRPSTVCGYSPRMRLDLVVNILTSQAIYDKKMKIFGGKQKRPNIVIEDMVRAYDFILNADERKIDRQVFNVGFENKTLFEIAEAVQARTNNAPFSILPTNDNRSYHVNSDKIASIGFENRYVIDDAIRSILVAANADLFGENPLNNSNYFNIKRMQELGL